MNRSWTEVCFVWFVRYEGARKMRSVARCNSFISRRRRTDECLIVSENIGRLVAFYGVGEFCELSECVHLVYIC